MTDLDSTAGKYASAVQILRESENEYGQVMKMDIDGFEFDDEYNIQDKVSDITDEDLINERERDKESFSDQELDVDESESEESESETENVNKIISLPLINIPKAPKASVIRVEECSLSDTDEKRELNYHILKSPEPKSKSSTQSKSQSPEEPVIIDLDDYSKNSDNQDDEIDILQHFETENRPFENKVKNSENLSNVSKQQNHSDKCLSKVSLPNDEKENLAHSQENIKEKVQETPKQTKTDQLTREQSPVNWEITSIFSSNQNASDEGNINFHKNNFDILKQDRMNRSATETEVSGADSGIFEMSFCDLRAEHNNWHQHEQALEKTYQESVKRQKSINEITSSQNDNEADNFFQNSNFISNAQKNQSSFFQNSHIPMTKPLLTSNLTSKQGPCQLSTPTGIPFYPYKAITSTEDIPFLGTNQVGYHYAQFPCYDGYIPQNNYHHFQNIDNTPWAAMDLTEHLPIAPQTNSPWFLPPNNSNTSEYTPEFMKYFSSHGNDDEETDDADEFENIQVTFDSSPSSIPSGFSSLSNPESHITDYNLSPHQMVHPCSSSGVEKTELHNDFLSQWHSPAPKAAMPGMCLDHTAFNAAPITVPNIMQDPSMDKNFQPFGFPPPKRPYPSMADAMRSARSARAGSKRGLNIPKYQRSAACARLKDQIQSAKISTSSISNSCRGRRKMARMGSIKKVETFDESFPHPGLKVPQATDDGMLKNKARHNEPLNVRAVEIMTHWFQRNVENPYPSKVDKEAMAREGGITENQVKSWFANKRNRTNNTKPKVQKRAMEEKLLEVCHGLQRNHQNPMADNSHIIQQLSGIIQDYHQAQAKDMQH